MSRRRKVNYVINISNKGRLLIFILWIGILIGFAWFSKNGEVTNTSTNIDTNIETNIDISEFDLDVTSLDMEYWSESGLPYMVEFGSDSCVPCIQMYPILQYVNGETVGKAYIKFIDVWKYPEAAVDYPISLIPTQLFFVAGGAPYIPSEYIETEFEFVYVGDVHTYTKHVGSIKQQELVVILRNMGVDIELLETE